MRRIQVFAAAVLLACTVTATVRADGPAVGRATGVKVLLVGDTNAFPNGDAAADVAGVERYVRGLPGFDPDRDLRVLEGGDDTAGRIIDAVDGLDVRPTDALLVYYEGHGAYDASRGYGDPSDGHVLQIKSGDLRRADLMERMTAKGARLTVLITETCNGAADYAPQGHELAQAAEDEPIASASLEHLLYDFTGVVDVNAASQGQSSWSNPDGGWFTQSLLRTLDDDDQFRDPAAPPWMKDVNAKTWELTENWSMFLDRVSDKTHTVFLQHQEAARTAPEPVSQGARDTRQELLKQEDERPQVFQLKVQPVGQPDEDNDFVPPPPPNPITGLPWDDPLPPVK